MTTPKFGTRVKVKIDCWTGHSGDEAHVAGEIGLVTLNGENTEGQATVGVLFENDHRPIFLPRLEVTENLEWATPREEALIHELSEVLFDNDVARQRGRARRISIALLQAYDKGLERFTREETARLKREQVEADAQVAAEADEITALGVGPA